MTVSESEVREGYRMTELGELPEQWEVVKFGEICGVALGRTPKRSEKTYWDRGKHPWVTISDMDDFGLVRHTNEAVSDAAFEDIFKGAYVPRGTLLMSFKLTIGRTAILDVDALHNEAIVSIRPKEPKVVSRDYLFYFLPTIEYSRYYDQVIKGKTLNKGKINRLLIPLPPMAEQRKIAAILQTVQQAKERTEAVIQAARELKKSLLKYLFTYGPVPVDEAEQVELKETEIGAIPNEWEVVELGEVFDIQQGKALSPKAREGKSPRPFLRTRNVYWGMLDLHDVDQMDFSEDEVERYRLQPGDLLVCEGGDIGRTAIWNGELGLCCCQNHLHRLRTSRDDVVALFFSYWMQTAILHFGLYRGTANVTTISNLSKSRLSKFSVPLPPLSRQKRVALVLQAVEDKITVEEDHKLALEELFNTLLNDLMTAKIRVNDLELGEVDHDEAGR